MPNIAADTSTWSGLYTVPYVPKECDILHYFPFLKLATQHQMVYISKSVIILIYYILNDNKQQSLSESHLQVCNSQSDLQVV